MKLNALIVKPFIDLKKYKFIPDNKSPHFTWEAQVKQYEVYGIEGLSYFKGMLDNNTWVDCLLYRNKEGKLVGILNHYPFTDRWERRGNINIFVDPKERRKGIGKFLLTEAVKLFNIDLTQQYWTESGKRLLISYLRQQNG